MKITKKILNLFLIITIIVVGWFVWSRLEVSKGILIKTDKREYREKENPKITIENKLRENICFSSCYPYYLEKN